MAQHHKTHMLGCAVERPQGGHPRSPQGKHRWGGFPWAKVIQDIDAGAPKTPSPRSPGCEGWLRQGSPADGPVGGAAPMSRMTFDRGVPPHSLLPHNPPRRPPECLNQGVLFLPRVFSITEQGYPAFYCFSPPANLGGRGGHILLDLPEASNGERRGATVERPTYLGEVPRCGLPQVPRRCAQRPPQLTEGQGSGVGRARMRRRAVLLEVSTGGGDLEEGLQVEALPMACPSRRRGCRGGH